MLSSLLLLLSLQRAVVTCNNRCHSLTTEVVPSIPPPPHYTTVTPTCLTLYRSTMRSSFCSSVGLRQWITRGGQGPYATPQPPPKCLHSLKCISTKLPSPLLQQHFVISKKFHQRKPLRVIKKNPLSATGRIGLTARRSDRKIRLFLRKYEDTTTEKMYE